jgi:hypothetical protein
MAECRAAGTRDLRPNSSDSADDAKPSRTLIARFRALPQIVRVALASYAVVALFAAAYGLVALIWPSLSTAGTVTIATLVAGPLALALLWPRMTGLKAFGIEVTLAGAEVGVSGELVAGITTEALGSAAPEIVERVTGAIVSPEDELIEINLGAGDYWWSTRLYLLSALLSDYSNVDHFVVVDRGAERRFLGFASVASVRQALTSASPLLETIYRAIQADVSKDATATTSTRVENLVYRWTSANFSSDMTKQVVEKEFRQLVSYDLLYDWLTAVRRRLVRDAVVWSGETTASLVRSIILEYESRCVALLREASLDRVVNRFELAERVAARQLR